MNIIEVFEKFPTQKDSIKHLEKIRWKDGICCPYCSDFNVNSYKKDLCTITLFKI